jgi:hypothetical protein
LSTIAGYFDVFSPSAMRHVRWQRRHWYSVTDSRACTIRSLRTMSAVPHVGQTPVSGDPEGPEGCGRTVMV